MLSYPAKIYQVTEEGQTYFTVEFFDFEGIYTDGDTLEEAQDMAQDALTGRLEVLLKNKEEFPKASPKEGKDIYDINPTFSFQLALWLKREREARGWTQQEIANRLKIKQQNYQKLEDPNKSNPSVSTLEKIQKAFGKELININ